MLSGVKSNQSMATLKLLRTIFFISVVGAWLLAGCGPKPGGESIATNVHSFDNTPNAVKQRWSAVLEAAKTNDYVGAQNLLYGLSLRELTDEQRQAVSKTLAEVYQRMSTAAEKGDPAALKALEELRRRPPNRFR